MKGHRERSESHAPHRHTSNRELFLALCITGSWFFVELLAGFLTNSLALLADAGHMLTDLAALSLSLVAVKISARPATHEKTYGYLRAEILAALANGIFLVLVAVYIFYEAYRRLMAPPIVKSGAMLAVASVGLVANLVTAGLLYRNQHKNLNIRGAFLHVVGDTLGSVGAIAAGIAMVVWQWYLADPLVSVVVAVLVLYSSWQLVRESVDVLLEGTPRHLNISSILADLGTVRGVLSVHDLHVWSITSGMPAMSCHIIIRSDEDSSTILAALSRLMREKHQIEHTTIQIERENWVVPMVGSKPLF
jgi:cobalt-zinc-cadmium efflux system protein